MSKRRPNTQLFALPAPLPGEIHIGGAAYKLVRVFKHDFFAATSLYEALCETDAPKVVLKFYRTRPFCGLPMGWLGRASRDHEKAIYAALEGIEGVPRWVGSLGAAGYAIEYIDGEPLDHMDRPPPGLFDNLHRIFEKIHACGVAYVDANKLSNMLVGPDGSPYLIDFQIAVHRRDDWPQPLRSVVARIVRYLQDRDTYHLYKHKRRLAPAELTDGQEELSRRRGWWHRLHRKITKPYRAARRAFLRRQYRTGRLKSPTADLEDHYQPEKDTWRR